MSSGCAFCEGWGCRRCKPGEFDDAGTGGYSSEEKEVFRLRARVTELETECTRRAMAFKNLRDVIAGLHASHPSLGLGALLVESAAIA